MHPPRRLSSFWIFRSDTCFRSKFQESTAKLPKDNTVGWLTQLDDDDIVVIPDQRCTTDETRPDNLPFQLNYEAEKQEDETFIPNISNHHREGFRD